MTETGHISLDHTHRAGAASWVASAQDADSDFPIQNLPFGVYRAGDAPPRIGVAIGNAVLDLARAFDLGLLAPLADLEQACRAPALNALMALGHPAARRLRHALFALLEAESRAAAHADALLVQQDAVTMQMPALVGDFTDFFTSIDHAERTGRMFRPEAPLSPNFRHLPVAYHGRASSLQPSGAPLVRPLGQRGAPDGAALYAASEKLDFELEVGFYIGPGNALGSPLTLDQAQLQVFGLSLVNDWSARDLQRWESQPLGPFLAKSFMTSVSPWVVTLDALAPFRRAAAQRGESAPPLSRFLSSPGHARSGAIDIALSAALQTPAMRAAGEPAAVVSQPHFAGQYWSIFQMLTHHASNGCNLRSGDLLASGTVSDPGRANSGCLLELTDNGAAPIVLPNGEQRAWLEDGDYIELRGRCHGGDFRSIGFGACGAFIHAAPALAPEENDHGVATRI